jgi:hypothetical protein
MAQKINPRSLRMTPDFSGFSAAYADVFYTNLLHPDWNAQTKFTDLFAKSKRFKVIKAASRRRRKKRAILPVASFLNHLPYKQLFAGIWCKHLPKLSMRQNIPYRVVRKPRKPRNRLLTQQKSNRSVRRS